MDWDKLSREQMLHILKDAIPETAADALNACWVEQDKLKAKDLISKPTCRDCEAIQHTLMLK